MSERETPRDEAESYIESLSAGSAVEPGQFTIDPARARELLRDFRLADPATWVVEVLQAAVLSGADRMDVAVTRSRVSLTFDGQPFDVDDLTLADNALLADDTTAAGARRARLAAGLAGAAALAPEHVEVRSGHDGHVTLLERRPDRPDRIAEVEGDLEGTAITVERESDPPDDAPAGWEPPEADRLTRQGWFAPLTLTVNGRRVSGGLALPHGQLVIPIDEEGLRGIAGIEDDAHPAQVLVIQHGAVIAQETLPGGPAGFVAVLEAPSVKRDLGLGRARRDAALEAVLRAAGHARDQVVREAARVAERHRLAEGRDALAMARRTLRSVFLEGGLKDLPGTSALPVWPILARVESDDHVSLSHLRSLAGRTAALPYVTRSLDALAPEDRQLLLGRRGILHLASPAEAARLGERLGVTTLCLDDDVRAEPRNDVADRISLALRVLGFVGVLLLVLAGLVVPVGTAQYHRRLVTEWGWPTARARVEAASHAWTRTGSGKSRKIVYRVSARYIYTVGGRTFRRSVDRLRDHPSEAAARRHVEELKRDGFTLRHHPHRWDEVLLEPRPPSHALGIGAVLELGLLLGLGFWIRHRRALIATDGAYGERARRQRLIDRLNRPAPGSRGRRRRKRR